MADSASILGLAARAGEVVSGEDICFREIRNKRARLVLLALDAGANGAKKVRDKCSFYGVPLLVIMDRKTLGRAIGKDERTVVVITSAAFAGMIKRAEGGKPGIESPVNPGGDGI